MKILAGTYTTKDSRGIYTFEFEDGKMSEASLFCEVKSSKYLCKYEDKIIAICDGGEKDFPVSYLDPVVHNVFI